MKRILAALGLSLATLGAGAEDITFAIGEHEFRDYLNRQVPGHDVVAFLKDVAERAGYEPVFEVSTWHRSIELTRLGRAELTFPWSYTEERAVDFLSTAPVVYAKKYIYVKAGNPPLETREQLVGTSGCYPTGFKTEGFLSEMFESGEVDRQSVYTMDVCFRMLHAGRVDFVLTSEGMAGKTIPVTGLSLDDFQRGPEPHSAEPQVILVSRAVDNAEEIVERLNAALAAAREEAPQS